MTKVPSDREREGEKYRDLERDREREREKGRYRGLDRERGTVNELRKLVVSLEMF